MTGYIIRGKECGRDQDGNFRCVCGKCEKVEVDFGEPIKAEVKIDGNPIFEAAIKAARDRGNNPIMFTAQATHDTSEGKS